MKIYILERKNNKEICNLLKNKTYEIVEDVANCNVLIVSLVKETKNALNIIDMALQQGSEVLCIRPSDGYYNFTCNLLIREGAMYV